MVIYCKGYDRNGHCFGQLLNVSNQGCGDLVVGSPLKLFIFNINKWSANRGRTTQGGGGGGGNHLSLLQYPACHTS